MFIRTNSMQNVNRITRNMQDIIESIYKFLTADCIGWSKK